jgi:hypothetical protein
MHLLVNGWIWTVTVLLVLAGFVVVTLVSAATQRGGASASWPSCRWR